MQVSQINGATIAVPDTTGSSRAAQIGRTGREVDFSRLVAAFTGGTGEALASAESTAARGLGGQAPVHEVVQSILEAEQRLAASIAVRDRIVAAYQEISRMAI